MPYLFSRRLGALATALIMLALPGLTCAEDIDLYTGKPSNTALPNVIILLDSSSAWNGSANYTCPAPYSGVVSATNAGKDVGFEQCALYSAITTLGTNAQLAGYINVGFMRWDQNSGGGYFKYPQPQPQLLPMIGDSSGSTTSTGATNLSALQTVIKGISRQVNGGDGSNNPNTGGGMQEVWAYYARKKGLSGTDYSTLPALNACQKNFVIYIANAMNNGDPNQSSNVWLTALSSAGATTAQQQTISINPYSKYQGKGGGPEWARFMYQTDLSGSTTNTNPQNIVTYTIAVTDGKNPEYVNYVQTMAAYGGGKSFVVNINDPNALNDLINDLVKTFNEVQATNSVFASVSLPVSVNSQGMSLNQVYVGMFRPDPNALPRWVGNLKQYQLGFDTSNNVVLEDSLGQPAISNASTGFISSNALSFWSADAQSGTPRNGPFTITTTGYTTTLISNWPTSGFFLYKATGASGAFDAADGEIVDKGGVGEMLRAEFLTDRSTRMIYTCNSVGGCPTTSGSTLPKFDSNNTSLTPTLLGTTTATDATSLINWIRGDDNTSPNNETTQGPGSPVSIRASIHGDVLHSRPAVVNYGGNIGIVAFYGSNDGFFRAINANKDPVSGVTSPPPSVITMSDTNKRLVRPGGELWSFIAPEFFSKFMRLRNNSPTLTLGAVSSGKDYFFDGTTTAFQDTRDPKNPKVYVYLTARRGGRMIYAFDVSDPTKPPVFLWSKSNKDIAELGQTWSQPKLAMVKGNTNPVIIMGGGYDPAEDSDPVASTDTQGRAILVLDALSGSTVWSACPGAACTVQVPAMTYAIPSDVTLLDRNGDGYTDRLYTGDLGGNIWRADINDSSPANWSVTQLASLGGTSTNARKFFYPPDVVPTAGFDAVVGATGDREHPLLSNNSSTVINRFYMIRDTNVGTSSTGWTVVTENMLTDETGAAAGTTTPYDPTTTGAGFYVTLIHSGEKAVNAPLTVAGYTYFGTNTPTDPKADKNICYPNLGVARGYALSPLYATGLNANGFIVFDGGGLPPSPVFGIVQIPISGGGVLPTPVLIGGGNQLGTGGGDDKSSEGAQKVIPPGTGKRKRTYWYIDGVK